MTSPSHEAGRPTPPALSALLAEYFQNQTDAHSEGLGFAETVGEVEPFEAVPVQPVDPKQAWADALAVAGHFQCVQPPRSAPADWPTLVASQEPAVALAFCLGNYPQMVRNLHPLLARHDLAARRTPPPRVAEATALVAWARGCAGPAERLSAAGVLRLAGEFDAAAELLRGQASSEWEPVRANEEAALAWHRGRAEEAAALWRKQPDSTPVLFNRGMAALFLGDAAGAVDALTAATAALPETGAWHHLGRLYLALASAGD